VALVYGRKSAGLGESKKKEEEGRTISTESGCLVAALFSGAISPHSNYLNDNADMLETLDDLHLMRVGNGPSSSSFFLLSAKPG